MSFATNRFQSMKDMSSNYIENIQKSKLNLSIKTGFRTLDSLCNGLQLGSFVIIASRPSLGKHIFSLNIAEHIAFKQKIPVAYFSLDSTNERCMQTLFSSLTNIERHKLGKVEIEEQHIKLLNNTASEIQNSPLYFSSSNCLSLSSICEDIESLNREVGLKVVIIDTFQLLRNYSRDDSSNLPKAFELARTLKTLASKLDIVIIALSEVNREVEKRSCKRPQLYDLSLPNNVIDEASQIMFIYRDEVYNRKSREKGIAEIIVAKNDFNLLGTVQLSFNRMYSKFSDMSKKHMT